MKNLLLVVAHPDDESFAMAGTAAKYVQAGWTVRVICATEGSGFKEAALILGIQSVIMLGYKDGTLAGREPGEIEEKVFRYMVSFAPDVTITFEPKGISNHPDHMKLTRAATYAFQRYAKEVAEGKEPRLYYACMPESVGMYLLKTKILPKESFGKPWSMVPDKFITTIIDISRFAKIKEKVLQVHKSQRDDVNWLVRHEFFILRMQGTKEVYMGKNDRVSNRL